MIFMIIINLLFGISITGGGGGKRRVGEGSLGTGNKGTSEEMEALCILIMVGG